MLALLMQYVNDRRCYGQQVTQQINRIHILPVLNL